MAVFVQNCHGNSNLIEESINPEDPRTKFHSTYIPNTYYIRRLREFLFYTTPLEWIFRDEK